MLQNGQQNIARPSGQSQKVCSIVIVSWNVCDLLRACLHSIERQPDAEGREVIVIDNHSTDGSPEMVRKRFPNVQLIVNERNEGFARAVNAGIRQARGAFILVLNPDTELPDGSLRKLIQEASRYPRAGVIGPKLISPDGPLQKSVRRFPDFWSQLLMLLKMHHVFPHLRVFQRYFADDHDYSKPSVVDQVMGSCFLIRKEVLNEIGMFDEGFWIWFEEVDFCKRVKDHSWDVLWIPEPTVIHHGGSSFSQVLKLRNQWNFLRSLNRYFSKHHTLPERIILYCAEPAALFLAGLHQIVHP